MINYFLIYVNLIHDHGYDLKSEIFTETTILQMLILILN